MASIGSLPDELIVMILKELIFKDFIRKHDNPQLMWRHDYLNLARTCKRFLRLAQEAKSIIENDYTYLQALHSVFAYSWQSDENEPELPESYGLCPSHGTAAHNENCIYTRLYPVLAFKHIKYTELILCMDLRRADCLMAIDNLNLDRITRLCLHRCTMRKGALQLMISKLRNLAQLKLANNFYVDSCDPETPATTRTLGTLSLMEDGDSGNTYLCVPAKELIICSDVIESRHKEYMRRFKNVLERVTMSCSKPNDWPEIKREYSLEDARFRLAWKPGAGSIYPMVQWICDLLDYGWDMDQYDSETIIDD